MDIKLTTAQLEKWLNQEPDEFGIEQFRKKYNIAADSDLLYVAFNRWVGEGKLKRSSRGYYRKVKPIEAIRWWNGEEKTAIKFVWPQSHSDTEYSCFGFEDNIEIFPGDVILIAGESNWGKTCLALNLLIDNLHLFEGTILMVNEYKPQRFRNRMKKFDWVDYWNEGIPKFEMIPITENHVDYIKPNYLNVLDWIHVKSDFWDVATITQDIGMQLREGGIAVVVIQKTGGKPLGIGGDWGKFFPAVYLTLNPPGVLKLEKVKSSPEGVSNPEGTMYAFDIIERGSKFHRIRQVKTCPKCKGSRYAFGKECELCKKHGYIELEEL